jgi:hypothetical protein
VVATKLSIWNGALNILKQRRVTSTTDDVEARYVLDDVWDRDFIDTILEKGLWNHAMVTVLIDADTSYTDPLGAGWNRFTIPDDYVRAAGIFTNGNFTDPDLSYKEEAGAIYSTQSTIYMRYISNGASYGADYSLWPKSFTRFAEYYLAWLASGRLVDSDAERQEVERLAQRALTEARSRDAMKEPTTFPPESSWNRARSGRWSNRSRKDYGGMF